MKKPAQLYIKNRKKNAAHVTRGKRPPGRKNPGEKKVEKREKTGKRTDTEILVERIRAKMK